MFTILRPIEMSNGREKHRKVMLLWRLLLWVGVGMVIGSWVGCASTDPLDKKPVLCTSGSDCTAGQTCVHSVCAPVLQGTLPPTPPLDAGPVDQPPTDSTCSPAPEQCNNKDDDCDGKIDQFTEACSIDTPGPCSQGQRTCTAGAWSPCQVPAIPSLDLCDGVDNNCNGQIDEDFQEGPCFEGSANKINKGICRSGTERCKEGKKVCEGQVLPQAEVCGDLTDKNCNGQLNDTCGATPNIWVSKGEKSSHLNVGFHEGYTFASSTGGVSYYKLRPNGFSCQTHVLLITPVNMQAQNREPLAVGYECSSEWYKLYFARYARAQSQAGVTTAHLTPSFHAISPKTGVWGRFRCVTNQGCKQELVGGDERPISLVATSTELTVKFIHGSKYCAQAGQPVFATGFGDSKPGYVAGRSNGNNECVFFGYSPEGINAMQSISFWIPDPTKQAWATVNQQGKITAENNFGDPVNSWEVLTSNEQANVRIGSHNVTKTAVLVMPYLENSTSPVLTALGVTTTADPTQTLFNNVLVRPYGWADTRSAFTPVLRDFTIMLLHNP
ncbi:MAG: hypothetical protein EP343_13685 [Deltaproteobacteria bacterium]|nr:MAG: hypothetical protein EP343_13685 [Deltaproteobacteria bacterium]